MADEDLRQAERAFLAQPHDATRVLAYGDALRRAGRRPTPALLDRPIEWIDAPPTPEALRALCGRPEAPARGLVLALERVARPADLPAELAAWPGTHIDVRWRQPLRSPWLEGLLAAPNLISLDYRALGAPAARWELEPLGRARGLIRLTLRMDVITDALGVVATPALTELILEERLHPGWRSVAATRELRELVRLSPGLERLDLLRARRRLSDQELRELRLPSLRVLRFHAEGKLGVKTTAALQELPLEELAVGGGRLDAETVYRLAAFPRLRRLEVAPVDAAAQSALDRVAEQGRIAVS